ncbi:MAG: UDP-N-acetylmuramate dehydrogenase [Burkholderiales bacterium]|nr:UDP-N-acetylmuramate dehydrogenase [Burkholderiales bacterium]
MLTIQQHIDLTPLNSLHLKSQAGSYTVLNNLEQLTQLAELIKTQAKFFVLGGGSNLIVPEFYSGLVIHNQLRGIEFSSVDDEFYLVRAMAGENWDNFVASCSEYGAYGLENLSLIPGTVGASPVQNIGAYGVEVKDFIEQVTVYDLECTELISLSNTECDFSYRNSYLKNDPRFIVVEVSFKLRKTAQLKISYGDIAEQMALISAPSAQDLRECIIATRRSKLPDPDEIGNAGSFFHNPIIPTAQAQQLALSYPKLPIYPTSNPEFSKISAGWLIDNLGLKGYRQDQVGVYYKQALVLVNHDTSTTQEELLSFAELIQQRVKQHYGIQLNIEPIIL